MSAPEQKPESNRDLTSAPSGTARSASFTKLEMPVEGPAQAGVHGGAGLGVKAQQRVQGVALF